MADGMNRNHEWLASCERQSIDLPHAGATFTDQTLAEFRDRLITLRKLGYRFPDDVLAAVEAEAREAHA